MRSNTAIFGLRFRSNENLQPSLEDLRLFLESRKKGMPGRLHADDLAPLRELQKAVEAFEQGRRLGVAAAELGLTLQHSVLAHSHLVKPALKLALEQYKFHLHALSELDFKKPAAFIKSAEEGMAGLNPKRKDEAVRLERMRTMVEERKRTLEGLRKQWLGRAGELSHLAEYVLENLARIRKLCSGAIALLGDDQVRTKKEQELIEDVKTEYKNRLRDSLHQGTITKQQMEAAKEEAEGVIRRLTGQLLRDVELLRGAYAAIHGHVDAIFRELQALHDDVERKKHTNFDDDLALFGRMEQVLMKLVADLRLERPAADAADASGPDSLILEKRREMLTYLLDLLQRGPQA